MNATADALAHRLAAGIGAGHHRMTVGLRPLDPALWIEDAPDHDEQLRERHDAGDFETKTQDKIEAAD